MSQKQAVCFELAFSVRVKVLCIFVFLWLISINVFSQTDTTRTIHPILITSEKDSVSKISVITSPVPHFVLNAEVLKNLAVRDVGSALRFVPGVQLKDYGGIGGIKTVSFRSLGANHTGVMVDGIKLPNVQTGSINLNPVESFGVANIVFTSGQVEDINAPASAFLTGNFIAVNSFLAVRPEKFSVKLYSCANSLSIFEEGFLIRIPAGKKVFFALQGFTRFGEGDYKFVSYNQNEKIELRRENSQLASFKLQGSAGLNFKNGKSLVRFSYYNNEQELPGAMILYNPYNDQKLWNEDLNFGLTHEHHFKNLKVNLHAFYQSARLRYYDSDFLNLQGYIDNNYHQQNLGSGIMLRRVILKNRGAIQTGSDLIYSGLKGNAESVPTRLESNSVLAFKYGLKRMKLESNVTLQAVADVVSDSDTMISRNFLEASPFISLSWRPFENSPLHMRSFYKRTFALPTFNDLYYNLIGNTNLKPERAHLFNAGVSYNFKHKNWYTEFSADGFYNLIEDKIIAIPTKDLFNWSMQNIGKVNVIGYDLGALYHYSKGDWKCTVNGSYSYNLSLDVTDPEGTTYQKQIPYTPFHAANGGLIFARKNTVLSTNFIYTGFRYSLNENNWANYLEPFTDWSISISQSIKAGKHLEFDLTLAALNILNKNYQVIRSFPMPGRYYQLTVNLNLK